MIDIILCDVRNKSRIRSKAEYEVKQKASSGWHDGMLRLLDTRSRCVRCNG